MTDIRTSGLERVIERLGVLTREFAASGSYPFKGRQLGRASMDLLFALSRANGLSVAELARRVRVTSGAVSQTIDTLRSAGLVTSEVNPADRRGRIVRLTDEARIEVDGFERRYFDGLAPRFDDLSTDEILQLDQILALIVDTRAPDRSVSATNTLATPVIAGGPRQ